MTRGSERAHDATHCIHCGEPLRITGAISLRFHTAGKSHIGWHVLPECEAAGWNAARKGEDPQPTKGKAAS